MNILFIGLPGAGKSTISKLYSKKVNKTIIEVDELLEKKINMPLQEYINNYGNEEFKKHEEELLLDIVKNNKNSIISPPGSIIYYPSVINYVKKNKNYKTIYLECSLDCVLKRTENFKNRGVVMNTHDKNPYQALYNERIPYYNSMCDIKINGEQNSNDILNLINEYMKQI